MCPPPPLAPPSPLFTAITSTRELSPSARRPGRPRPLPAHWPPRPAPLSYWLERASLNANTHLPLRRLRQLRSAAHGLKPRGFTLFA